MMGCRSFAKVTLRESWSKMAQCRHTCCTIYNIAQKEYHHLQCSNFVLFEYVVSIQRMCSGLRCLGVIGSDGVYTFIQGLLPLEQTLTTIVVSLENCFRRKF